MSNNPRQVYKRKLEQANGNLDTYMQYLLEMQIVYQPEHPEIAEQLQVCLDGAIMLQTLTEQIGQSI